MALRCKKKMYCFKKHVRKVTLKSQLSSQTWIRASGQLDSRWWTWHTCEICCPRGLFPSRVKDNSINSINGFIIQEVLSRSIHMNPDILSQTRANNSSPGSSGYDCTWRSVQRSACNLGCGCGSQQHPPQQQHGTHLLSGKLCLSARRPSVRVS